MKRIKLVAGILIVSLIALCISTFGTKMVRAGENEDTIYTGLQLDGVDVGGMTKEEATQVFEDYLATIQDTQVVFDAGDITYETTIKDLNVTIHTQEAIESAYEYGRQGNILQRYKEIRDVEREPVSLSVEKEIDVEALTTILDEELSEHVVTMKNASMKMVDGQLTVIPEVEGEELDTKATANELMDILTAGISKDPINVTVTIVQQDPDYTTEDFAGVDDILGEFKTYYSGDVSRNNNIINAASKMNGIVVYPGEEFDTMSHLVPFTVANGWNYAGAYLNGEVISDIGGGICQVSTTLYNAVLLSELEISERYPHSMAVGYVQLSADAALNEGTKNFKFVNSTDKSIYIQASASGGTLYFAIYGKETRKPGRSLVFKNEITETIAPGEPIETMDETLEPGYRETKQTAHTGYSAKLWKYVYKNGELVDTILVNTSKYSASAERITVGPPAPEPAPEAPTPAPETPSTETPTTETPTTETPTTEPITPGSTQTTPSNTP